MRLYGLKNHKSKSYLINKEYLKGEFVVETYQINLVRTFTETDISSVKKIKLNNEYSSYLQSDKWKDFRKSVIDLRGNKCEVCASTVKLTVHHLHYRNIFNETFEDVQILCQNCHNKEHGLYQKVKI